MKGVLLRVAISHGVGWTIPGLVLIETLNLQQSDPLYVHWATTIDMVNGSHILLLPVCAGIACAVTIPVMRRWHMVSAVPDSGLRAIGWPMVIVATVCSLVHVMTLAVVIIVGYLRGLPGHPNPLPGVAVVVAFYVASSLGVLVARVAPSLISAPFCVVSVYLLEIFLPRMLPRPFSDFGGATHVLLGLGNRIDVILAQSLFLLILATVLILVGTFGRSIIKMPRLVGPLTALLAMSAVLLWSRGDHRFEEVAVRYACDEGHPRVCIAREYENELSFYGARVRHFHEELVELGVKDLPSVYNQAAGADVPSGGRFSSSADSVPEQTALEVLESAFPCSTEWNDRDFTRAELILGYMIEGEGGRLYPGAPKASRESAVASLDELSCQ